MWLTGASMPEQALSYICGRIRVWLALKVLPLTAVVVVLMFVSPVDKIAKISVGVLYVLWMSVIAWRDLKRLGRLKRREFLWCSGVTAGFVGRRHRGIVQVGSETVRSYGHPANMFYLANGIPVYVVSLNVRTSSVSRGGFITDPLAFRIKDQAQ
ncbi:MAG: hypothetical protein IKP47_02470 [Ruminococcus sp.]|nr:hypothetical protein [Ruminococcus sp.]